METWLDSWQRMILVNVAVGGVSVNQGTLQKLRNQKLIKHLWCDATDSPKQGLTFCPMSFKHICSSVCIYHAQYQPQMFQLMSSSVCRLNDRHSPACLKQVGRIRCNQLKQIRHRADLRGTLNTLTFFPTFIFNFCCRVFPQWRLIFLLQLYFSPQNVTRTLSSLS